MTWWRSLLQSSAAFLSHRHGNHLYIPWENADTKTGWRLTYPSEKYECVCWDYSQINKCSKPPTRKVLTIRSSLRENTSPITFWKSLLVQTSTCRISSVSVGKNIKHRCIKEKLADRSSILHPRSSKCPRQRFLPIVQCQTRGQTSRLVATLVAIPLEICSSAETSNFNSFTLIPTLKLSFCLRAYTIETCEVIKNILYISNWKKA